MAKKIIKAQMKQRIDTKANWASNNPVLLLGELGMVSDDPNLYKVGDGTTAWNALPFRGFDGTITQETGSSENTVMSQKAVTEALAELRETTDIFIEDLQNTKIDKEADDYYPQLSVGLADNLAGGDEPTPSEFTFRKSGGGAILSGNARVQSVKGNSVVWNQLINNILSGTTYQKAWYPRRGVNYASAQNGEIELRFDSQSDAFGNSLRQQIDVRPGDKIYTSYDYESHNVDEFGRRVYMAFTAGWSSRATLSDNCLAKGGEVVGHAEGFSVVPSDNSIDTLCIYFCYTNIASPDTTPLKIANFRFVNLTRMFGAGNEPTTIEEYHSRIPQGIDMDAYNGGEVIHMDVQSIESVGVNQWDEEWRSGKYDITTGQHVDGNAHICSSNYIRITPNTKYYGVSPSTTWGVFYDNNKHIIPNAHVTINNAEFTTPSNAYYMMFYTMPDYGTTYNHDICINLSDASINGKYFPYVKRMQSLDIISRYFPDGMKSAGSAHDEIRFNKTTQKWEKVKRIGEVDLGTLSWAYDTNNLFFRVEVPKSFTRLPFYSNNLLCVKYFVNETSKTPSAWLDKEMALYNGAAYPLLGIKDSAYTDAASFKTAMAGVILYYELANPIVTEIEEAFNLDYEVWNGGTEQAIADTPTSAFKADIIYGFNAYGVIKELREQLATLQAVIAKMNA